MKKNCIRFNKQYRSHQPLMPELHHKKFVEPTPGVPRTEQILKISSISEFPGNNGLKVYSSAMMQPTALMSIFMKPFSSSPWNIQNHSVLYHSSLLGPSGCYKEYEVSWKRSQIWNLKWNENSFNAFQLNQGILTEKESSIQLTPS